jgi:hypothetical protein
MEAERAASETGLTAAREKPTSRGLFHARLGEKRGQKNA